MNDNQVEGWTNYETWNLALWINNDQQVQNFWRAEAKKSLSKVKEVRESFTKHEEASFLLADTLKDSIEDKNPLENLRSVNHFYKDILTAAIASVNWYEVAKSLIEDVLEDETFEERHPN